MAKEGGGPGSRRCCRKVCPRQRFVSRRTIRGSCPRVESCLEDGTADEAGIFSSRSGLFQAWAAGRSKGCNQEARRTQSLRSAGGKIRYRARSRQNRRNSDVFPEEKLPWVLGISAIWRLSAARRRGLALLWCKNPGPRQDLYDPEGHEASLRLARRLF